MPVGKNERRLEQIKRERENPDPMKDRQLRPLPLVEERKKAGFFVQTILRVSEEFKDKTGPERKAAAKKILDDLIYLPPIAEEISDFIISLGVEIAYASIKNVGVMDRWVEKSKYDELDAKYKKLAEDYRKVYDQYIKPTLG